MREEIQRSLLEDLKRILSAHKVPRSAYDSLYRAVMAEEVTSTVNRYKSLNLVLCAESHPVFVFPNGYNLVLEGRPGLVRALRQCLGFFSRLHANVTEEIKTQQLRDAMARVSAQPRFEVDDSTTIDMRAFIEYVIGAVPPSPDTWDMKHGPGAVAEVSRANKGSFRKIAPGLVKLCDTVSRDIPLGDATSDQPTGWIREDRDRWFRMPHAPRLHLTVEDMPTRVVTVPKDATKVRIISCEPAATQFVQQGIMSYMYRRLGRFPAISPLDQSRNRQLALRGSVTHEVATLDSSNASDNVRWLHVKKLFPADWVLLFDKLRTPSMQFPEGVVNITTFAPMGSALCFPVELLVFASIAYASMRQLSLVADPKSFLARDDVGFFGDDVIVPEVVVDKYLHIAALMGIPINESKSCRGDARFRESCGLDCFEGSDVSIVRPREVSNRRSAAAPMVLHANRLFAHGFVVTAQALAKFVRVPVSLGYGPHLAEPGLKWPAYGKVRYNAALQRFEGKAPYNRVVPPPEPGQDWEALFMWFTNRRQSESPFVDKQKEIPSEMWVPLEPEFALVQADLLHRRIPYSVGSKPRVDSMPSAYDPKSVFGSSCTEAIPGHSYSLEEWKYVLTALGFLAEAEAV